ncbi:unnamed protein product [Echinostoma caproni]|uniref:Protein kinase domain-containing protein n=1 Tax=Echinostoma caproni TaxID=27848 RepID=A0A183B0X7_9TREM|nr:unnamed protein product [Echinostoma caproni]
MRYIVETQGLPPPDLLQNASKFNSFFVRDPYQCELRLKTQEEYALETGQQAKEARKYFFTSLSQICEVSGLPGPEDPDREFEQEDRQQFANLLAMMLKLRPHERVVPDAALVHPFITMSHLQTFPFSKRFHESINLMQVCHEASRRQQQQKQEQQQHQQLLLHAKGNGDNNGIQYLSTSSLNDLPSHRFPRSALTSPSAATVNTGSNPTLFAHDALTAPIPQSSAVHPTGTAVAYYAAAAVAAAALAKPNGVGQNDSCYFRQNRVPVLIPDSHVSTAFLDRTNPTHRATATYSTSTDYSDYPAAAAAAAVLMAQQKSRTGGVRTRQANSALMHQMSAVPRSSLSLYDLVTAGGSALSLLNAAVSAAAAPAPSSTSLSGISSVRTNPFPGHFHSASSSYDGLHKLGQPLQAKYSKPESGSRLSTEAEHAALMLSSYLGREQPMSVRSGDSVIAVSGTAGDSELCDSLHAFVQQQQHHQQRHLCRNSTVQPQSGLPIRQQSRHLHQQSQTLLLASDLSVASDDHEKSKELSSVSGQSNTFSQSVYLAQQAYHQAYPKHICTIQSQTQAVRRSLSHSERQQFVRPIPCSQLVDAVPQPSPNVMVSSKPVSGIGVTNSALDVMPINLVTGDGIHVCSSGPSLGPVVGSSGDSVPNSCAQPAWCSQSAQRGPDNERREEHDDRNPHDLTNSHTSVIDRSLLPVCGNVSFSQSKCSGVYVRTMMYSF